MQSKVVWLIGRGASIACGLHWNLSESEGKLNRESQISIIKEKLPQAMKKVNSEPYSKLVRILEKRTTSKYFHRFVTTNWDCLLQNELSSLCESKESVPNAFGMNSHVYHLNGTVEDTPEDLRSKILLESDKPELRKMRFESNEAFNAILESNIFVVVGMSFECVIDRYTLAALGHHGTEMPVASSNWLLVNPSREQAEKVANEIRGYLPDTKFKFVNEGFDEWIRRGARELCDIGVLSA
ncbi:MAG: hypothetical protein ACJAYB_002416 [Psychromonas sp.]